MAELTTAAVRLVRAVTRRAEAAEARHRRLEELDCRTCRYAGMRGAVWTCHVTVGAAVPCALHGNGCRGWAALLDEPEFDEDGTELPAGRR